jgi:hypothetical protein
MFDGLPKWQPSRSSLAYSVPTGHPPVAERLADQVRSSSGMTLGRRRPGGGPAMLAPAFVKGGRIPEPPVSRRSADRPVPASDVRDDAPIGIRLLAELRRVDAGDHVLMPRTELRDRYGIGFIGALFALRRSGDLAFWMGHSADRADIRNEMVVRLKGSRHELRTPAAPAHIIL